MARLYVAPRPFLQFAKSPFPGRFREQDPVNILRAETARAPHHDSPAFGIPLQYRTRSYPSPRRTVAGTVIWPFAVSLE